jgi:CTP synthase
LGKKLKKIQIGMVGKYTELHDAYLSIIESLKIACMYAKVELKLK